MDGRIESLCRRAKKGDGAAIYELLEAHYGDIFAYLRRLCGRRQDAEDLTQETFVRAWSSLDSFRGRSRFSTWLHSIAHNNYVSWRRRCKTNEPRPDQWWRECMDQDPGPFVNVARRQMAECLYRTVDRLDEDKKHVVHLHYYQDLSLRETAKVLGISTGTVKYRLREALKDLRKLVPVDRNQYDREEAIPAAEGETS
jgi:RNA polymerase sigma-70 factor (ECF subfamily)